MVRGGGGGWRHGWAPPPRVTCTQSTESTLDFTVHWCTMYSTLYAQFITSDNFDEGKNTELAKSGSSTQDCRIYLC